MKKTIPLVILVILAVTLAGCVEEKPTKVVEENPTASVTQSPTTTELKLKIGETAKTSRLEVTVKKVFKTKVVGGDYENYWAKDDKVFVLAVVSIKNIDPESKAWVEADFAMSDETGKRYDMQYMDIEEYFESGDLNPKEYREGLIAFEVPEHVKKVKIKYDFGGFFKVKLATWEIDMSKIPKEPKVKILGGRLNITKVGEYYIVEKVIVRVKNEGELPIYLGDVEVKYGAEEDWGYLGYVGKLLKPGEEKTIEETEFAILDSKPAVVKIRFVDDDHVIAEGTI